MGTVRRLAHERPLSAFFVLAYAIAWLAWAPLYLSQAGLGLLPFKASLWYTLPGSYAPLLAAVLVRWLGSHGFGIPRFRPLYALGGYLLGAALIALGFILLPGLWLTRGTLTGVDWAAFSLYPAAIARAVVMAGPIGEEPGWRGFALPRMEARLGQLRAWIILGLLWAGWHLPLFLVPQWNARPIWIYALLVMAFAFVINLGFNVSRRSVIVAILLHATFNASSAVLGGFLGDASLDLSTPPDIVIAVCLGAVAMIVGVTVAVTASRLLSHGERRPDA
jgi:membrane protease YdiL (CAAX protease family)